MPSLCFSMERKFYKHSWKLPLKNSNYNNVNSYSFIKPKKEVWYFDKIFYPNHIYYFTIHFNKKRHLSSINLKIGLQSIQKPTNSIFLTEELIFYTSGTYDPFKKKHLARCPLQRETLEFQINLTSYTMAINSRFKNICVKLPKNCFKPFFAFKNYQGTIHILRQYELHCVPKGPSEKQKNSHCITLNSTTDPPSNSTRFYQIFMSLLPPVLVILVLIIVVLILCVSTKPT